VNVSVGWRTDVGRMRAGNEDAYLIEVPLFVVADGMGGHIAGDVASSTAVQTIAEHLRAADAADPETLAQLVRDANAAIWDKAQSDVSLSGMGTTCTLVLIDGERAHIAHVGDSRAYRLRSGALERLTQDHTLVARMVKEGRLRPEEAERHPQRNMITRALGVDPDVRVDLTAVDLDEGDRLLLCSDGLPSMVQEDSIEEALAAETDPQAAADRLVDMANEAGGEDNITVVVIDVAADGSGPATAGRVRTEPPAPQQRHDTDSDHLGYSPARGRWLRRLIVPLLALAAFGAGAYFAAGYVLDNSWFVGVNDDGFVTIYSGIPDEVAGFELWRVEQVTDISVSELPSFARDNVRQEMKFDSLSEAETNITNIERIRREFAEPRTGRRREIK
jgi:PPM family protein phosphatase